MQDFDSLKDLWKENPINSDSPAPQPFSSASIGTKLKLQRQQYRGGLSLILTAILIAAMALFGNFNFQHWYTYGAMVLLCIICLVQAAIFLFTYKKIKSIDDTAAPSAHLEQWESYYAFRKRQVRINLPLYFVLLNMAMALYLVELFTGRPVVNVIIFLLIYVGWMLFAYFYIGKKNLKKENARLQSIIDELKELENQFDQ